MSDYLRSLEDRRKESARQRQRYWSDPEFRLDRINRARARFGIQPADSLDDVQHKGPIAA